MAHDRLALKRPSAVRCIDSFYPSKKFRRRDGFNSVNPRECFAFDPNRRYDTAKNGIDIGHPYSTGCGLGTGNSMKCKRSAGSPLALHPSLLGSRGILLLWMTARCKTR
jgi:hypothetical protein